MVKTTAAINKKRGEHKALPEKYSIGKLIT